MKPCMMRGCTAPAYELAPGLPTLYCVAHRAAVVAQARMTFAVEGAR